MYEDQRQGQWPCKCTGKMLSKEALTPARHVPALSMVTDASYWSYGFRSDINELDRSDCVK